MASKTDTPAPSTESNSSTDVIINAVESVASAHAEVANLLDILVRPNYPGANKLKECSSILFLSSFIIRLTPFYSLWGVCQHF